jgi:large subunit ribosomal protein L21
MFAIVKTGGKQYRVGEGDIISVEKIAAEAGAEVELSEVLLIENGGALKVGNPTVSGAKVRAQVLSQEKDKKILVFKKKRRKGFKKLKGHRQQLTTLKIKAIEA